MGLGSFLLQNQLVGSVGMLCTGAELMAASMDVGRRQIRTRRGSDPAGETRCSPPPSAVSHQLQIQVELKSTKWAPSIQVKTSSRTLIARRLQRTTMSGSRG